MLIFFLEENTEDTHLFFPWREDSFRQSNIIYFFVGNQRAPQFFLGKKCWFFSWKKMLKTLIYFFLGKKWWVFDSKKMMKTLIYFFLGKKIVFHHEDIFFILPSPKFPRRKKKQKVLINKELFFNLLNFPKNMFVFIKK